MDKLISQLNPAAGNLQDIDVIEGQVNTSTESKKYTGLQMRAVEKAEREAQDNVIEAGAGLQADGTYLAEANSWNMRSADFLAGTTDRGGATGALTANIQNALRLLDAKISASGIGSVVNLQSNLNADTTLTDIVPAGYMLEYIVFKEKLGQSPILDLGTTAGGNEVLLNTPLTPSGLTVVPLAAMYSLTVNQTLYLNDDDAGSTWDGAVVDVYFVLKPITASGATGNGVIIIGYYTGAYGFTLPPTEAELITLLGSAANYTGGTVFIIRDTTWIGGDAVFVMSNGTTWDINTATFVPAL